MRRPTNLLNILFRGFENHDSNAVDRSSDSKVLKSTLRVADWRVN